MVRRLVLVVSAVLLGLLGSACGDESDQTAGEQAGAYHCDNTSLDGTCVQYLNAITETDARATCDGQVNAGGCPSDGAVAECETNGLLVVYYADVAAAEAACSNVGGSFEEQ